MGRLKKNIQVYILGIAFLLVAIIAYSAADFPNKDGFELARQEILLRKVGHEILLHAGDSTSRVLPVERNGPDGYRIRFENEFTFETDSLVSIINRVLLKEVTTPDYIVSIMNCASDDVLFGFAMSRKEKDNLIPCTGRKQPKACYLINLKFQDPPVLSVKNTYVIGGISIFAFIGFVIAGPALWRRRKIKYAAPVENNFITIGNTLFDPSKKQIIVSGITTELTPKENRLLAILADAPNAIIERARIQKEIWEDEGVIVGRSLDVFISKLRKKLEHDESVRLVNVHGKGYKLEIGGPDNNS